MIEAGISPSNIPLLYTSSSRDAIPIPTVIINGLLVLQLGIGEVRLFADYLHSINKLTEYLTCGATSAFFYILAFQTLARLVMLGFQGVRLVHSLSRRAFLFLSTVRGWDK